MIEGKIKKNKLDKTYLEIAKVWSKMSYCKRKQVGCIIVKDKTIISDGYNGTPSGFENKCECKKGLTKDIVLHAEANALTKLAKSNNSSKGATLYTTLSPCLNCAKLILQSGITRLVFIKEHSDITGLNMLQKAGVLIEFLKDD